jgi:alkylhydroperoxidase family enzyme
MLRYGIAAVAVLLRTRAPSGATNRSFAMNILPASNNGPNGAAALLGHADPAELDRFASLEDAVWGETTLAPAVVEAVRLHCARIRGCEFCAAVRYKPAIDDGLSESLVAHLGSADARSDFDAKQSAALTLADRYLLDPYKPEPTRAGEIANTLGESGIVEVLVACGAFASADLRIALGENREPDGDKIFDREFASNDRPAVSPGWPALGGAILDPHVEFPAISPAVFAPIRERLRVLWSGRDLEPRLVAAIIVRSSQLHGVDRDDPVRDFLVPERALPLADPDDVRNWTGWSADRGRHEMSLAEQLWMDPAGVNEAMIEPLLAARGKDGLIRVAWHLILIGQLHRLALVLHRTRDSA